VFSPVAGVLSYLVPGLGQIVQGRVAKGVLFMVCIYGLFFYGLFLGSGTATVQAATTPGAVPINSTPATKYCLNGSVYLPANPTNPQFTLADSLWNRPQFIAQFWVGVASWPAIYQYSVYDPTKTYDQQELGGFMRQPGGAALGPNSISGPDEDLNAVHTSNDKMMELGWVFSVIAGVLNIMVIYDAVAGPAFPSAPRSAKQEK
jgi:hypothetical protein